MLSIGIKRLPFFTDVVPEFNMVMKKTILVLSADEKECSEICDLLNEQHFRTVSIHSLPEMITFIHDIECLVVIMDLDSVPIDNRTIRELTIKYPDIYFLCISSDRFHPHLKEALCYHIYACINKPVDPDELIYWVGSIHKNESDPNN
jgi:DNA-binding NtrC family response regulator